MVSGQWQKVVGSAAEGLSAQVGKIGNELLKYRTADASAMPFPLTTDRQARFAPLTTFSALHLCSIREWGGAGDFAEEASEVALVAESGLKSDFDQRYPAFR